MASAARFGAYNPSDEDAQRYWQAESSRAVPDVDLPAGFPRKLNSTLAWTRADIEEKHSSWKLEFTEDELSFIDEALSSFEAQHEDLSSICASTFPLPTSLIERLQDVSTKIYGSGVGFHILHGLDPTRYSQRQNVIVFAGLTAHVCPRRGFVDNQCEDVVSHIVNVRQEEGDPTPKAPGFTNTALSFHSDNCEILTFYYLDKAAVGGETLLASSWQTYNELAARRPDVLCTMAEPWIHDTYKDYSQAPPRSFAPLEVLDEERVLLRFSRYPITGWQRQRNPELPAPTDAQLEAIDAVHFTSAKNAITLPISKGDLLFVNDMAIMHARKSFDEGDQHMQRHIMKMYVRDPAQNWPIAPSAQAVWTKMYGLSLPHDGRKEVWNINHKPGLEDSANSNG